MSVMSDCPFDKAHVCLIRVNAMLTLDKIKPELLSPRWPNCCHVGWLDASFYYIVGIGVRTASWRRIRLHEGRARLCQGCAQLSRGCARLP
jgi:hypothetical protein